MRKSAAAPAFGILAAVCALWLSGCGGGSSASMSVPGSPSGNIVVTLSPSASQTVDQNQALNLTASVANDRTNAGVKWSVSGGGSLMTSTSMSATYSAPTSGSAPISATVTATSVTDSTKSASVQIAVNPQPVVATASVPAATIGSAYSATISVTSGTSPFAWAITSGMLPAGLALGSSTSNSVTISGMPTTAGSASVMLQVTDAAHASSTQTLSFVVDPPAVAFVITNLPGGVINEAYSQTLEATSGVPPYVWSIAAGSLPPGLALNTNSGVVSGTPKATGVFAFMVKVTDTNTPTASSATANSSITINPPLAIVTTSLPSGSVLSAYAQAISVTGGVPPYSFVLVSGNLPSGLQLNPNGGITGTPTAPASATSFSFRVVDSNANLADTDSVSGSLSITVAAANCPNDKNFAGNYAFLVGHTVGSLVSDGAGNITSGFSDAAASNSPDTLTGTYCIGFNNLGTLTLASRIASSATPGSPVTYAIALQSNGNGSIGAFDASSGVVLKQDPTAFSLSKITGNYELGLCGLLCTIGALTANGQGSLSGELQLGDPNGLSVSSNDFVVSSEGRCSATLNTPDGQGFGFVFYIVDSSHLLVTVGDSSQISGLNVSGEMIQQTGGPYTNASLNGTVVLEVDGAGTASLGLITFDGTGKFTLSADENAAGTMSTLTSTGTYSVASNGRVILTTEQAGLSMTIVLYLSSPNTGSLVNQNVNFGNLGTIELQSGGPTFTNGSFSGTYAGATSSAAQSTGNEVDTITADGAGTISGATDFTSISGLPGSGSIMGTYAVSSSGRGTVTQGGSTSYVFYVVSPTKVVLLTTTTSPYLVAAAH